MDYLLYDEDGRFTQSLGLLFEVIGKFFLKDFKEHRLVRDGGSEFHSFGP